MKVADLPTMHCVPFPFFVTVIASEDEWDEVKAELEATHENWTATGTACVRQFSQRSVVCIPHTPEDGEVDNSFRCLAVHEAVHCFQNLCETIGENNPSTEFEAYYVQSISNFILDALDEKRLESDEKAAKNDAEMASGTQ